MGKKLLHTPEGVRDIYGTEYERMLSIKESLNHTIKKYGYDNIQTPTFEYFDIFSKEIGTTPSKELYKFFDNEGNTLVLRSDFTPSIARCAAKYYMEDPNPIRFCYSGNTFTNTSNLQGKLKEVTQVGAELINDDTVMADAEVISMVVEALKSTGLKEFQVSIGQVEYFKGLCEEAGLSEELELELRAYISGKNYFAAQDLLAETNISEEYKKTLLRVADMFSNMTSLAEAKTLVKNERSIAAINRLEQLYEVLKQYKVEQYISFDLGMLSKYNYYTGVIFRAYTYGIGNAVVKGGRYNNLLRHFGKDAPAIGFVIAVDDLLESLDRQRVDFPNKNNKIKVYYTNADFSDKLKEAQDLRAKGFACELIPE